MQQRKLGADHPHTADAALNLGKLLLDKGDYAEAAKHMQRALSTAPERPDLQADHSRISTLLAKQLADDYEAQAKFEESQGKWASAALSWGRVSDGRPDDDLLALDEALDQLAKSAPKVTLPPEI